VPLEASSSAVVPGTDAQQQQDDCSDLEDRAGQEPSLLQVTDTGQVKAHPSRMRALTTCLTCATCAHLAATSHCAIALC
jgi:hypothetical protein